MLKCADEMPEMLMAIFSPVLFRICHQNTALATIHSKALLTMNNSSAKISPQPNAMRSVMRSFNIRLAYSFRSESFECWSTKASRLDPLVCCISLLLLIFSDAGGEVFGSSRQMIGAGRLRSACMTLDDNPSHRLRGARS